MDYIQPAGFTVFRADRKETLSGKSKGGGICFMTNTWCDGGNVQELLFPSLGHQMLPLPREFSGITAMAVYILPQADIEKALKDLQWTLDIHCCGGLLQNSFQNQAPKLLPTY